MRVRWHDGCCDGDNGVDAAPAIALKLLRAWICVVLTACADRPFDNKHETLRANIVTVRVKNRCLEIVSLRSRCKGRYLKLGRSSSIEGKESSFVVLFGGAFQLESSIIILQKGRESLNIAFDFV